MNLNLKTFKLVPFLFSLFISLFLLSFFLHFCPVSTWMFGSFHFQRKSRNEKGHNKMNLEGSDQKRRKIEQKTEERILKEILEKRRRKKRERKKRERQWKSCCFKVRFRIGRKEKRILNEPFFFQEKNPRFLLSLPHRFESIVNSSDCRREQKESRNQGMSERENEWKREWMTREEEEKKK